MAFDILAAVLGWGFKTTADGILKALTPSELSSRLKATTESWTRSLPPGFEIDPSAVFSLRDREAGQARKLISQRITDGRLPTGNEWFDALMERWMAAGKGPDMQPFFNRPANEVSPHLLTLAERLAEVCQTDERMFRGAVLRFEEWRRAEAAAAHATTSQHAALFINDVIEPSNYSTSYEIDFHAHNPTADEMVIGRMRIEVQEVRKINLHRTVTPGAPVDRFSFQAHLLADSPQVQLVPMNAGPREFRLAPRGASDLFSVTISAAPDHEYIVRLTANETNLRDNQRSILKTPELCLTFAGT
jgi:hypothetical protein